MHDDSHLSPETLARLATEPPAADEAEHLARCAACGGELAGLRAQLAAVAALPRIPAPDLLWPALARTLRAEGLMRADSARAEPVPGAAARGEPARHRSVRPSARTFHAAARAAAGLLLCIASGLIGARAERRRAERGATRLDAPAAVAGRPAPPAPVDSAAVVARLVAFETLVVTSDEAVRAAPDDPVLRHYRAEAQAARNAVLRHVALTVTGTWY